MASKSTDPTFRTYTSDQAKIYASGRPSYSPALYNLILGHHTSNGAQLGMLLDVGCGPGNATRDLAVHFEDVVGCDAGEAMVEAARGIGGKTGSGRDVRFEVASGEDFGAVGGLSEAGEGKVDMLTVAKAHWFDMNKFWAEAAKVVKPGGTVAIWTRASGFPHPKMYNANKLREIMLNFEQNVLGPYEMPGNRLSRDMYEKLALPWQIPSPVSSFPESGFVRHDFDRDGVLTNGENFFGGDQPLKLKQIEKALSTASMVTRWRAAHPELVGTEKDCVKSFVAELREVLEGREEVLQGAAIAVLLFKRSA